MIKNLVIGVLIANLGVAYWIINKNTKTMKSLQEASQRCEKKFKDLDVKKITIELKNEINKQFYALLFTRIKR